MHLLGNDNKILNLRLNVKIKLLSPLRIVIAYDYCRAAKHIHVENTAIRHLRFFVVKESLVQALRSSGIKYSVVENRLSEAFRALILCVMCSGESNAALCKTILR